MGILKEKVIGAVGAGQDLVQVTFKNDTKCPQGFYDAGGNLVMVRPGETKEYTALRVKAPASVKVEVASIVSPDKPATEGAGNVDRRGGRPKSDKG